MNISLKGTGIDLTPAISAYAEKRLEIIRKYFEADKMPKFFVELGKESAHHKHGEVFRAEVQISGSGQDFYAVSHSEDLYTAIDLVKDEIIHEITKTKGRRERLLRKGQRVFKNAVRFFTDRS